METEELFSESADLWAKTTKGGGAILNKAKDQLLYLQSKLAENLESYSCCDSILFST